MCGDEDNKNNNLCSSSAGSSSNNRRLRRPSTRNRNRLNLHHKANGGGGDALHVHPLVPLPQLDQQPSPHCCQLIQQEVRALKQTIVELQAKQLVDKKMLENKIQILERQINKEKSGMGMVSTSLAVSNSTTTNCMGLSTSITNDDKPAERKRRKIAQINQKNELDNKFKSTLSTVTLEKFAKELSKWFEDGNNNKTKVYHTVDDGIDNGTKKKLKITVPGDAGKASLLSKKGNSSADKKWPDVISVICKGGQQVSEFVIGDNLPPYGIWSLSNYAWFPNDLVETLIKNALETEHPDNVVAYVDLVMPPNSTVSKPPMELIARESAHIQLVNAYRFGEEEYELTNKRTGAKFVFSLYFDKNRDHQEEMNRFAIWRNLINE